MVGGLDKSTTQFYQGRPTRVARLVEFVCSLCIRRDMNAVNRWHN